jgi:hypothetical protein
VPSKTESRQATGFIHSLRAGFIVAEQAGTSALSQTNRIRSYAPDSLPSSLYANRQTEWAYCFSTTRANDEGRGAS